MGQLGKIFNVLGTPITSFPAAGDNKESTVLKSVAAADRNRVWLDADLLPAFVAFEECAPLDLSAIFRGGGGSSSSGAKADLVAQSTNLALLERMLVLSPNRRITAAQVRAGTASHPIPSPRIL